MATKPVPAASETTSTTIIAPSGPTRNDVGKDVGIVLLTGALGGLAGAFIALIHNGVTKSTHGNTESVGSASLIGFVSGLIISIAAVVIYMAYASAKRHSQYLTREQAYHAATTGNYVATTSGNVAKPTNPQAYGSLLQGQLPNVTLTQPARA